MKKADLGLKKKNLKVVTRTSFYVTRAAKEMIGSEKLEKENHTLYLTCPGALLSEEELRKIKIVGGKVSSDIFLNQVIEKNYRLCPMPNIFSAVIFKKELYPGESVCLAMIPTSSRFDRTLGKRVQFAKTKRILVLKKTINHELLIKISHLPDQIPLQRRFIVRSW